ncbi:DUF349 domain-containing protein [Reinekea thalattae]|uniref:DUF349 domain-containing protein n=1 Tax=Reinekea thalattae TaxID=2593301 RepID=A0A5C8ZBM5_9GAMM|nr:DUF349 domain-containing protein [Reinekea thalattae]TXR54210.1 DUF349 domain-containing protein [Reinekea thalattae]
MFFKRFSNKKAQQPNNKEKISAQKHTALLKNPESQHSKHQYPKFQNPEQAAQQFDQLDSAAQAKLLKTVLEYIDQGDWQAADVCTAFSGQAKNSVAIEFDLAVDDDSEESWQQLVLFGITSKIKKYAAQQIQSLAVLTELMQQTKGKDKAVYRILQATLSQQKEQQQAEQTHQQQKQQLLTRLQKLLSAPYEPMSRAKLTLLSEQWQTQADISDTEQQSFDALVAQLVDKFDQYDEQHNETTDQSAIVELADVEQVHTQAEAQAKNQNQTEPLESESSVESAEFSSANSSQNEAKSHSTNAMPADVAEAVKALRGQLRRCTAAIRDGHLRRASGLFQGAEEQRQALASQWQPVVQKQYDETFDELEKLRDWQAFAVLPKKQVLIERMQQLVNQHLDPEDRAKTIKDMQDEWKLLSRGLKDRQKELWQQFHDLSNQAFEPCREYFAEQRKLRQVNLAKRQEVVAQLNLYAERIDLDRVDAKELDQVLQVARNDWRKYAPVDRNDNKKVQAEFDAIHKKLFALMSAQQVQHLAAKEDIIERSKALLEIEDAHQATEAAKALQQEWKQAGMVARKDEQRLWQAFRQVCDQLFERRDAQMQQSKAQQQASIEQAEVIVTQLESFLNAELESCRDKKAEFEALHTEFKALSDIPSAAYKKLAERVRAAAAQFSQRCDAEQRAELDVQWVSTIDWVKQARFGQHSQTELVEQWQAEKRPAQSKGLINLLSHWAEPAQAEYLQSLHEKTVELEVLAGLNSPPEDAALRMSTQVKLLSNGVGSGVDELADFHQRVAQWLAVGPVEPLDYEPLEARMKQARTVRLS